MQHAPIKASASPVARRELIALACSIGLMPLNSTMIAVAIPAIAADLAAAPGVLIQWLVTSYLVVGIVAQSPAGKLGDREGYTRALALGQAVFACGSVLGFLAHALPLLVAARVLMAVGGAIIMPSAMAMVRVRLPEAQRARAFGMFGAVMGLSAAIGPLIGGEIASRFGWPALFLVNIAPLALARVLGSGKGPVPDREPTQARKARFDVLGSVLLGLGLVLVVIGARSPALWLPLVGTGLATLFAFVWWERRATDPVVDLRLFMHRAFTAGTLIVGLQNFAMYALLFELPVVFSRSFGATSAQSGRALLALTLAMVVGSMLGGRVAGAIGSRKGALFGSLVAFAGGVLLALRPLAGVTDSLPALLVLGFGLGFTTPAATAALMAVARPGESGMASAVSSTMRYLGGIAGVAVVSALVAGDDILAAHRSAAVVFALALGLATALATVIPRHKVSAR